MQQSERPYYTWFGFTNIILVITKGYGVRATTINVKTLLLHCVSFTWQIVKTRVITLQVIEGLNSRDQIAFFASIHSKWKSKRMLTTYMRRMRNNNLGLGLRAPLCCPQLDNVMTIKKPIIAAILRLKKSVLPTNDPPLPWHTLLCNLCDPFLIPVSWSLWLHLAPIPHYIWYPFLHFVPVNTCDEPNPNELNLFFWSISTGLVLYEVFWETALLPLP